MHNEFIEELSHKPPTIINFSLRLSSFLKSNNINC